MKRKLAFLSVSVIIIFLTLVSSIYFRPKKYQMDLPYCSTINKSDSEENCYQFVLSHLYDDHSIRTNYLEPPFTADYATGKEVLSESQGLFMRYAIATKNKQLLKELYEFTFTKLNSPLLCYRYDPDNHQRFNVNAAVDNLRIIRALLEAYQIFNSKDYLVKARELSKHLLSTNVSHSRLYDFYDATAQQHNNSITLCYNDLYTIKHLASFDSSWSAVYDQMYRITQEGYISDAFPFYETRYNYSTNAYEHGDSINMIEALLTAYHLAEIDMLPPVTTKFIEKQMSQGHFYAYYSLDGEPATQMESTAVYALCAMIASQVSNQLLYEKAITKMTQLQVTEPSSPIYGAYGDVTSYAVYSFDNLMALLAYRMEP